MLGASVSHYRVLRRIAPGGMGVLRCCRSGAVPEDAGRAGNRFAQSCGSGRLREYGRDTVFDGTLKDALEVALQQSPYMQLVSRAAYEDFFAEWKDADPDIPAPRSGETGVRATEAVSRGIGIGIEVNF